MIKVELVGVRRRGGPTAYAERMVAARTVYERDGRSWSIGTDDTVSWINALTTPGMGIDAGVPPIYARYATLVLPDENQSDQDDILLDLLVRHSPGPWWLGYLRVGDDTHDVAVDLPAATLYTDWQYTVIRADPRQGATWRSAHSARGKLPDLMYPTNRSWLVTHLWDDQWRGIGGPTDLIDTLLTKFPEAARSVTPQQDATPPGHTAI